MEGVWGIATALPKNDNRASGFAIEQSYEHTLDTPVIGAVYLAQ